MSTLTGYLKDTRVRQAGWVTLAENRGEGACVNYFSDLEFYPRTMTDAAKSKSVATSSRD